MSYQISVNHEDGFVELRYSGIVDLEERIAARAEVFRLCREHGLNRTLVDSHQSNILMSTHDVIQFGKSFKDIDLPTDYRVACVIARRDDASSMLEVIASTEGLDIKGFLYRDDALKWLLAY